MKTKEYYIEKHREMWNWLAENPDKDKNDWPGWESVRRVGNDCFLCGYMFQLGNDSCGDCPLDWVITKTCMDGEPEMSYYRLYESTGIRCQRSFYAETIANLPEKKEI